MTDFTYPYPLGRIIQHDPRSRGFALPESDPATLSSKKWKRYAPIFDQGNLGSCTGNACLGAVGTGPLHEKLVVLKRVPEYNQATAVDIYSKASAIDEWPGQYPPEDTGSSGLAVAKIAKENGWISSYFHAFSLNAALTALQTGPVITGINWYTSFYYPSSNGECTILSGSYPAGGHEIAVDEIDVENSRVWFTNSWGSGWGLNGRAWLSFETWQRLLNEYGDVTQFMPMETPLPVDPTPEPETPDGCLAKAIGPWATKVLTQKWQTKKNRTIAQEALKWIEIKNLTY